MNDQELDPSAALHLLVKHRLRLLPVVDVRMMTEDAGQLTGWACGITPTEWVHAKTPELAIAAAVRQLSARVKP